MTRKRRRPRAIPGTIPPTPERLAKAAGGYDDLTEAQTGGVTRPTGAIRVWSQLENLYRNRRITTEQYDAGMKFASDYYLGIEAGHGVTMRWSEYISGIGGGNSENMEAAERRVFHSRRYAAAIHLLRDDRIDQAIQWLIVENASAEQIGRRFKGYRAPRAAMASGVTIVTFGLQRLAKFYGIVK